MARFLFFISLLLCACLSTAQLRIWQTTERAIGGRFDDSGVQVLATPQGDSVLAFDSLRVNPGAIASDRRTIVRYAADGKVIWRHEVNFTPARLTNFLAENTLHAIRVASNGDVIVAVNTDSFFTSTTVFRRLRASDGVLLWERHIVPAGGQINWTMSDFAVDRSDNIVIAGSMDDPFTGDSSIGVVKLRGSDGADYSSTFNFSFVPAAASAGSRIGAGPITVDGSGNVYVAGVVERSIFFNIEIFLAKFKAAGNPEWNTSYSAFGVNTGRAKSLAIDPTSKFAYLAGSINFNGSDDDLVVTKFLTESGNLEWDYLYNGTASGDDSASAMALDANGNVYVVGQVINTTSREDVVALKIAASAVSPIAPSWIREYQEPGAAIPTDLAVYGNDSLYITGQSQQTNTRGDIYLAGISTAGANLFQTILDGGSKGPDSGASVAVGSTGTVFVAGTISDRSLANEAFLTKFYRGTLTFTPSTVTGGTAITGKLSLNGPAPVGGTTFALSSSDSAVTVPSSLAIAEGATESPNFTITTKPVTTTVNSVIKATFQNTFVAGIATVKDPRLDSLTANPASVVGGQSGTVTVTLTGPAPTAGSIITLSSSLSSGVQVPATVKVNPGQTSTNFSYTTSPVRFKTNFLITASLAGASKTATVSVEPPKLRAFTISTPSVQGGASPIGRVTLDGPTAAGGVTVTLTRTEATAASVPATVLVPEGERSATFDISTFPVATKKTSVVTATSGIALSASLDVLPPTLRSLTISPLSVSGGNAVTGKVSLSGLAPTGGLSVALTSSASFVTVPGTVLVPAGTSSTVFTITTKATPRDTSVAIKAALGSSTLTTNFTVVAATVASITLSPNEVFGSDGLVATIKLDQAPTGEAIKVDLSSSEASVKLPASVTFGRGVRSVDVSVTTESVTTDRSVLITATRGDRSRSASLVVKAPIVVEVQLNKTTVAGGTTVQATVVLNRPAPAGGIVVSLLSSNTSVATVAPGVLVPAGAISQTFAVATLTQTQNRSVRIRAIFGSTVFSPALVVTP